MSYVLNRFLKLKSDFLCRLEWTRNCKGWMRRRTRQTILVNLHKINSRMMNPAIIFCDWVAKWYFVWFEWPCCCRWIYVANIFVWRCLNLTWSEESCLRFADKAVIFQCRIGNIFGRRIPVQLIKGHQKEVGFLNSF